MTTGETPRTEAGRALLDDPHGTAGIIDAWGGDDLRHAILAIEREAAAAPPEPPRPDHAEAADALMAALQENGGPYDEDATQDAIDVLAEHGFEVRPLAAPEGLSLDVERLAEAIDNVVGDLRVVGEAGDIAAEYARLSPSSGESGSPPAIDEDRLFEALSFLGEDDILADGSLWKIKEIALNAALEYNRVGSGSPGEDR